MDRLLVHSGGGEAVATLARVVVVAAALVVGTRRRLPVPTQWGLVAAALIAVSPQLWVHYLLVTVAAAVLLFGERHRPALAGLAVGCSVVNWLLSVEQVQSVELRLLTWCLAMGTLVGGLVVGLHHRPAAAPAGRCDDPR